MRFYCSWLVIDNKLERFSIFGEIYLVINISGNLFFGNKLCIWLLWVLWGWGYMDSVF